MAMLRLSARPWMGMRTRWSAAAATSSGRPWASLPNNHAVGPARSPRVCREVEVGLAGAVGREDRQAAGSQRVDGVRRARVDDERQVEQRAGRGAHRLAVVRVDRGACEDDAIGSRRVGAAHHGAGVAGVAYVDADGEQPGSAGEQLVEGLVQEGTDGDDPLRGHGACQRGQCAVLEQLPGHARLLGGRAEVAVLLGCMGRGEHLAHALGDEQRLTDRLRALGQEQPVLGAHVSLGEQPGRPDPAAPHGQQRVRPLALVGARRNRPLAQADASEASTLGALTSSGRAALAVSTRTANAGASLTARSARILRSTSTPATRRPWMNRL